MLDLNYVRENLTEVTEALEKRNASHEAFELLRTFDSADKARRRAIAESDKLNEERNLLTRQIGTLMQAGQADKALRLRAEVNDLKEAINKKNLWRDQCEADMREILAALPNIPHES